MVYSEVIKAPGITSLSSISAELNHLLGTLGFEVLSSTNDQIQATKLSPLGASQFLLTIRVAHNEIHLNAQPQPRALFLAFLPLTACSLLCSVSCGVACAIGCSCGASSLFIGQAGSGIKAYSRHLFQLIAAVIREKVRQQGACPKCGTPAQTGAKFCRNCGSPVA
jgi:hypothetical protein